MLILASQSPRRRALLSSLGVPFTAISADIDECNTFTNADDYVRQMAMQKSACILQRYPKASVLGADTVVVLDEMVFGKPNDKAHAWQMWRMLSGRVHTVKTALCLQRSGFCETVVVASWVQFYPLDDGRMSWYWRTQEPLDKAGAYGVQGLGAGLVQSVQGSYTNIMGLPLDATRALLQCANIQR